MLQSQFGWSTLILLIPFAFGCDTGSCYSVNLRDKHCCIENSMKNNCPICYEVCLLQLWCYLFFFPFKYSRCLCTRYYYCNAVSVWFPERDVCSQMWAHDALAMLPRDVEARQVIAHASLSPNPVTSFVSFVWSCFFLDNAIGVGSLVLYARRLSSTWTSSWGLWMLRYVVNFLVFHRNCTNLTEPYIALSEY